ncbi:MAG TPA: hypothetical protein VEC14_01150 [Reyranellaceae bacterium]|nr:hypothetical protein [Reyranellaceae bacterium]
MSRHLHRVQRSTEQTLLQRHGLGVRVGVSWNPMRSRSVVVLQSMADTIVAALPPGQALALAWGLVKRAVRAKLSTLFGRPL